MSAPLHRIPVGVVVERRKAVSPWAEVLWRPVAILAGLPEAGLWTPLSDAGGDTVTYYAGPSEIVLYRSDAENYRRNLASGAPSIWVTLHETGGEPPYAVAAVTADPAEGEGWTEPGQAIVEAVPMPEPVRGEVAAFVAQCPAEPDFVKRRRDRADPEALARRAPHIGRRDERR
jgi:hypothetical protein